MEEALQSAIEKAGVADVIETTAHGCTNGPSEVDRSLKEGLCRSRGRL